MGKSTPMQDGLDGVETRLCLYESPSCGKKKNSMLLNTTTRIVRAGGGDAPAAFARRAKQRPYSFAVILGKPTAGSEDCNGGNESVQRQYNQSYFFDAESLEALDVWVDVLTRVVS